MGEITAKNVSEFVQGFIRHGDVRVFECGKSRPEKLQDRPFMSLLEGQEGAFFLANTRGAGAAGDLTVSAGGANDRQDTTLETESHGYIQELQERFRHVRPDATLIMIDPDVVMGRYAADDSRDRSIHKEMQIFLQEELEKVGREHDIGINRKTAAEYADASIKSFDPAASTMGVDAGERQVSIIIPVNPDQANDFIDRPGYLERGKQIPNFWSRARDMIMLHEIFHAADPELRGAHDLGEGFAAEMLISHRTEVGADIHATLHDAKKYGDTKYGEMLGDIRSEMLIRDLSSFVAEMNDPDTFREHPNPLYNVVDHYNTVLSAAEEKGAEAVSGDDAGEAFEGEPAFEGEATAAGILDGVADSASMQGVLADLLMSYAYNTTPGIDAAVAFAKKELKAGRLQDMTDAEIYQKALDLRDKVCADKEKMAAFGLGLVSGEIPEELGEMIDRQIKAQGRMGIPQKELDKLYGKLAREEAKLEPYIFRAQDGFPVSLPEKPLSKEEKKNLDAWHAGVMKKIAEMGGKRSDLIKVVAAEKDAVRAGGFQNPVDSIKMKILNQQFLEDPRDAAKLSSAEDKIASMVGAAKVKASEGNLVSVFVASELNAMKAAEDAVMKAKERANVLLEPKEAAKAMIIENKDLTRMVQNEAASCKAAEEIVSKPELRQIIRSSSYIADLISERAAGKHHDWMPKILINIGDVQPWRTEAIEFSVAEERRDFASAVRKCKPLMAVLYKENPQLAADVKATAKAPDSNSVAKIKEKKLREAKLAGRA